MNRKVSKKVLTDAVGKYEDYSGRRASKARKITLPDPPAASVIIGEVVSITYRTKKNGRKSSDYIHRFKSRPLLVTDPKGKGLHIEKKRGVKVTDRGIEG